MLDAFYSSVAEDTILSGTPFGCSIRGFADTTGDRIYNQKLSEKRAAEIYTYLKKKSGEEGIPVIVRTEFWSWKNKNCNIVYELDSILYSSSLYPVSYAGYGEWSNGSEENSRIADIIKPRVLWICGGVYNTCGLPISDTSIVLENWGYLFFRSGSIQYEMRKNQKAKCDSLFSWKFEEILTEDKSNAAFSAKRKLIRLQLDVVPTKHFLERCDRTTKRIYSSGYYILPGAYLKIPVGEDSIKVERKASSASANPDIISFTSNDIGSSYFEYKSGKAEYFIYIPMSWLVEDSVYVTRYHKKDRTLQTYEVQVKFKKGMKVDYSDKSVTNQAMSLVKKFGLFKRRGIYTFTSYDIPEDITVAVTFPKRKIIKELSDFVNEGGRYVMK